MTTYVGTDTYLHVDPRTGLWTVATASHNTWNAWLAMGKPQRKGLTHESALELQAQILARIQHEQTGKGEGQTVSAENNTFRVEASLVREEGLKPRWILTIQKADSEGWEYVNSWSHVGKLNGGHFAVMKNWLKRNGADSLYRSISGKIKPINRAL